MWLSYIHLILTYHIPTVVVLLHYVYLFCAWLVKKYIFQTSPRGVFLSTSIIVAFHLDFLTKVDRIYRVQCFYMEMERRLEKEIVIKLVEENFALHGFTFLIRIFSISRMPPPTMYTKQVPMPVCKYEVLDSSPTGPPVYFATVGQMVKKYLRFIFLASL